MILQIWMLLAVIGFVTLAYALVARTDEISLITSVVSMFIWLIVAFGSLNIEVYSESQDAFFHQEEPALALLAMIGAFVCLVNAAFIVFDWARDESE